MSRLIKPQFFLAASGEFHCWDNSILEMEEEPGFYAFSGCCQLSPLSYFQHLKARSYASMLGVIKEK